MHRWLCLGSSFASVIVLAAFASAARAERVVARHASWNASATRIYTDLLIEHDDGTLRTLRVAGGEVGDVGMVQFELRPPGSPPPDAERYGVNPGFVRSRSAASGALLRWEKSCVYLTPDASGASDVASAQEHAILQQVLDHWRASTQSCSYLEFVVDDPTPAETIYDGKNVVKFREDKWCRPASGADPEECYSPSAAALTTVFYVNTPGKPNDGKIRDADIELNAVNFAVGVCTLSGCTTTGQGSVSDLANTLTHEIGHLVGLDHTCWDQPGPAPVDGSGQPVPSCSAPLTSAQLDATMYNYQDPAEIKKATVEADDVNGFCAIYPLAADPGNCSRALDKDDDGLCAVAAPGRGPDGERGGQGLAALFGVGGFGLLLVAGRGRSRRRR
jgi:hypothetical protein